MTVIDSLSEWPLIHGICPCCGSVFRLSEAEIDTGARRPRTDFDRLDAARARLEMDAWRFEEREREIRSRERERGRETARRRLRAIAAPIVGRGGDPRDVRPVGHPVALFRGLSSDRVGAVQFVDREPESKSHENILRSLDRALGKGNVEWQTWRADTDE